MLIKILLIVNFIALVACLFWIFNDFGYESVITLLLLVVGLLSIFITKTSSKNSGKVVQNQNGGQHSKNNQAGRDINL